MIPWSVRYSIARYEAGLPVAPHLLMAVQFVVHGFGCSGCSTSLDR